MIVNNGIPIKGVHLSFSAQMPRFEAILGMIDDLAHWGFNTFFLDYCGRFPFEGRLEKARMPDAFTKEQLLAILAKAEKNGIQIIPVLQCLGHMYWLLRLDEFADYGEGQGNEHQPVPLFGVKLSLAGLCPSHPDSLALFEEMADQMLSLHGNLRYFHIGGDEVELDPGCLRCKSRHETEGPGNILADYYKKAACLIRSKGPDPIMWGDMICAHPETFDSLRGHVTVMDWDYWSTLGPQPWCMLWGVRGNADKHNPETWREIQKKILRPYVYACEPHLFKSFPFTQLLRDQGFPVIVAPAARSHGGSTVVPKAMHADNTAAAVYAAIQNHSLGVVITNWDIRRSPWPLTELALITGGHLLNHPNATQRELDAHFAKEHFGTDDIAYAQIPRRLGQTGSDAVNAADLLSSRPTLDKPTGQRFARPFTDKDFEWARKNPSELKNVYERLRIAATESKAMLEKLTPREDRHKTRIALWLWACDMFLFYAELAPQILIQKGSHDKNVLEQLKANCETLHARTRRLLSSHYTDYTLQSEDQVRFQIHLAYLDEMMCS